MKIALQKEINQIFKIKENPTAQEIIELIDYRAVLLEHNEDIRVLKEERDEYKRLYDFHRPSDKFSDADIMEIITQARETEKDNDRLEKENEELRDRIVDIVMEK